MHLSWPTLLILTGLVTAACGRAPTDELRVLRDATAGAILPLYAEFVDGSRHFRDAATRFCEAPAAPAYAQARNAWSAAMLDWQQAQAVRFGPVTDDNQAWKVQFWPDRNNLVARQTEDLLAADDALTAARLEAASVVTQGLTAAEYLLFDAEGGAAGRYARGQAGGKRRCDLLRLIAAHTLGVAERLHTGWAADGADYATVFTNPGASNLQYPDPAIALATLLDSVLAGIESAKNDKLAEPLGLQNDLGIAQPYAVEAWRSRTSLSLQIATVEAAGRLYYAGTPDGTSFGVDDLLRARGAGPLAKDIDVAFAAAREAMPRDLVLFDAVSQPAQAARLAAYYDALTVLARLVKNEVPPVLGITLGFNDKDGD